MDPLSDIIALLRPHAAFSKPITGRGRWGVRYAAYESPSFCIVLAGHCWFAIEGSAPRLLERGDFMLLPVTPPSPLSANRVSIVPPASLQTQACDMATRKAILTFACLAERSRSSR